jgi:putative ATP-dependent endonuclease of OLD family
VFLRELQVENFRAIRRACVELDASTALVGENDSGTTSLLRALELGLGRATVELEGADFHRDSAGAPAGPLRIRLVFVERRPGEWSAPEHSPLLAVLPTRRERCRELVLEASAVPPAPSRSANMVVRVLGEAAASTQRQVVDHVRGMNPLIRVAGGMLTGRSPGAVQHTLARVGAARLPRAISGLVERIVTAADELLGGDAADPERCLQDGAAAARELLAARPQHIDPASTGLAGSVLEILGEPRSATVAAGDLAAVGDSAAERLGMLLLVAAVLRQLPGGLRSGVEPLWVIENPEANLHPMTLAATARLLNRIRWQKVVTTQSGELLATLPLAQVRRLVRHDGVVRSLGLRPRSLTRDDLRRVGYHLRQIRGVAMFARVWLLVEGESEFWILPQIANVLGYDLALEGVCCVAFAQCGLEPLVRTAHEFGIGWHLLADGDAAGEHYATAARRFVRRGEEATQLTILRQRDIEHCFWAHGHADTILQTAGLASDARPRLSPSQAIRKAVQRRSKPFLALSLVQSVAEQGPAGVPAPLARLVETCVALARRAPKWLVGGPAPDPRSSRRAVSNRER